MLRHIQLHEQLLPVFAGSSGVSGTLFSLHSWLSGTLLYVYSSYPAQYLMRTCYAGFLNDASASFRMEIFETGFYDKIMNLTHSALFT
jgi:hypothetical protein